MYSFVVLKRELLHSKAISILCSLHFVLIVVSMDIILPPQCYPLFIHSLEMPFCLDASHFIFFIVLQRINIQLVLFPLHAIQKVVELQYPGPVSLELSLPESQEFFL